VLGRHALQSSNAENPSPRQHSVLPSQKADEASLALEPFGAKSALHMHELACAKHWAPMPSSKKRVLYVWQSSYPWDVRVEKICLSLVRQGFDVEILARRGPGESRTASEKGIAIHRVGSPSRSRSLRVLSLPLPGNPVWSRAIRRRIRRFRPDLVIARDIPLALPTGAACKAAGIPWVIDMAEHYPVAMRTWKKYQRNPITRFAINTLRIPDRIEKRAVMEADGVMPVIEEQKQRLIRDYGCTPDSIVPVLNTPETERLPATISTRRSALSFGYHGVVIQDRDLLTVVRAFELAADRHSELTLTIAGEGESLADIRSALATSRHAGRVTLTGKKFEPAEAAGLYSAVDYGIVCWTVNDFTNNTIANKFFDYAAFGKPIIFAETLPMVRLMKTMNFGFGYKGGDPESCAEAMLKLVAANYEELASSGRKAVEAEYHWAVDARRMINFLSGLIERRAGLQADAQRNAQSGITTDTIPNQPSR
jgi:glycosyltransferase involved in cell wall biosynthesis